MATRARTLSTGAAATGRPRARSRTRALPPGQVRGGRSGRGSPIGLKGRRLIPKELGGAAVGQRGAVRNEPVPLLNQEQAIALFSQLNQQCVAANPDLSTDLAQFLNLVNGAMYNGIDLHSVIQTAYLGHLVDNKVSRSRGVTAGGAFSPGSTARRRLKGGRRGAVMPTYEWAAARANCSKLGALNRFIQSVTQGTLENNIPQGNPPIEVSPELEAWAAASAQQLANRYPQCGGNVQQSLQTFLELTAMQQQYGDKEYYLSGSDVYSIIRALGLAGNLSPIIPQSISRWAGGSVTDNTPPVRGKRLDADVTLPSLLDTIAQYYCPQMPMIVNAMSNLLAGRLVSAYAADTAAAAPK